jgi:hypothetical protein
MSAYQNTPSRLPANTDVGRPASFGADLRSELRDVLGEMLLWGTVLIVTVGGLGVTGHAVGEWIGAGVGALVGLLVFAAARLIWFVVSAARGVSGLVGHARSYGNARRSAPVAPPAGASPVTMGGTGDGSVRVQDGAGGAQAGAGATPWADLAGVSGAEIRSGLTKAVRSGVRGWVVEMLAGVISFMVVVSVCVVLGGVVASFLGALVGAGVGVGVFFIARFVPGLIDAVLMVCGIDDYLSKRAADRAGSPDA